jgi:hypothetical protein
VISNRLFFAYVLHNFAKTQIETRRTPPQISLRFPTPLLYNSQLPFHQKSGRELTDLRGGPACPNFDSTSR